MSITRFTLITLALWFVIPAQAIEPLNPAALLTQAEDITQAAYPDADDVVLDDRTETKYEADGTSVTVNDSAVKVLNERGKRDYRALSLSFNVSYGTNFFETVQLIKPDGRIIDVDPQQNSKVMVNPGQMSANIYNPNSKMVQLSVPGLEVGDILRTTTRDIVTKPVVPDTWSDYQVLEHTSPILRLTYRVIAPEELPLQRIALKAEVPGTVTSSKKHDQQNGRFIYTWEVRDVPRYFPEPNMPAAYTVVQRLLVSTIKNWEDLSKWYWDLCRPRLESTTPEMKSKAEELTKDAESIREKVEAIFSFVSQNIRYMGITTEEEAPGYEPHDVHITFENRYGVCRDKAALLVSMLQLVDVEAFPVIIMAGPKKDEEVPQPFFNHAVTAALDENGEYILMDSTDENTKDIFPSYLQNMSYLVARPEGDTLRTSPIIPAEENLLQIRSEGLLDNDGNLAGESTLTFEGINDTVYRNYFSKIKPEERIRFFEGHLKKSMPTAKLVSLELLPEELRNTSEPLTVRLNYTADNLLIEGDEQSMLNLPRLSSSLGYANFLIGQTGLEKREYPLYTRMTAGIREILNLELPEDNGSINLPEGTPIDTDQLGWSLRMQQREQALSITNEVMIRAVEFSPEQYLQLKDNLKDIEYSLRKNLILDNQADAVQPDARILEKSITYQLSSPSTWTERVRSRIKILTYAGKKEFSEIKLSYNPAWQEINVTKAIVTLPDGTVKEIRAEEINLMDAGWVASAARYPSEKILVVNLPGVEIGSVLEYEIQSTVDGKPFFSTVQSFNGHEPVDLKTVTLSAPAEMDIKVRNTGIEETRTVSEGTKTWTWTAVDQGPVKKEDNTPAWWTFNPVVFISTADWADYAETINGRLEAAANKQPETRALAKALTQDRREPREKIMALRNWVAENIRPAGPGLTQLPLDAISPADRTLQDRYGNNTDRMILLSALLQAAGFKPEFLLSGGISLIPEEAEPLLQVPERSSFNTVLLRLELDSSPIYLSGESQYAQLGATAFDRRPCLNLESGRIETIRTAPGMRERTHVVYEINVSESGQVGMTRSERELGTAFEGFHRLYAEMTPENRRRHYLEMVSGISQSARAVSDLETVYTTYPGAFSFSIVVDRYAVRDGDFLYFTLPGGLGNLMQYRSSERELPLARNNPIDQTVEYNIVLPEGFEPAILPESFSWQAPGGGVINFAVEYSKRAHAVRIVQMADLWPAFIPAKHFPDILEAGRTLAHPAMRTLLLKKQP